MGRGGILSALNALAKEAARQQRQKEAEQKRQERAQLQHQRQLDKEQRLADKEEQRRLEAARRSEERNRLAVERERSIQNKERLREQVALEKARVKEEAQLHKDGRRQECIDRDAKAKADLETLNNLLNYTLEINNAVDWNQLKDRTPYNIPQPKLKLSQPPEDQPLPPKTTEEVIPPMPIPAVRPSPPIKSWDKYQPVLGLMDKLIAPLRAKKNAETEALFQQDYAAWVEKCSKLDEHDIKVQRTWEGLKKDIENKNAILHAEWARAAETKKMENSERRKRWEEECDEIQINHKELLKKWELGKKKYFERQKEANIAIDVLRDKYMAGDQGAVANYCDSVLSNSAYPDSFPKKWDLSYNPETRTLIVEYALPAPEALPTLKEVQYVQSKDDFKEIHLSEKEREILYENTLYQIALRTSHEMFESDMANVIDAVVFNGIVTALNKTTGHHATACIVSMFARKESFLQINLSNIDPKACFKSFKGVSASKLSGLSPIAPIMMIDKNDRRFVPGYGVADYINEGTNLATMDWEDFEHLIREVFEQEFVSGGGEVKITQASHDRGVDAVAFDPDPIKGGKIVIQAKRYANTVGVAAVRDLYGTVINEGATKGLLVTTADIDRPDQIYRY